MRSDQDLQGHLEAQHDVINLRSSIQSRAVNVLQCDLCEITAPTREYLMTHISTHHSSQKVNPREAVCNICGDTFTTKPASLQHTKRHDAPRKTCDVCGVNHSPKCTFNRHTLVQHEPNQENSGNMKAKTQELRHICGPCNKTFQHQSHLKPHVSSGHNQ